MNTSSQNILVTGANGYLGAQICLELAHRGHAVTALCFPEAPEDDSWCSEMKEVLVGSVAEPDFYEQMKDRCFDAIVHLVSLDHHQSQNVAPETALRINVQPCWSLLNHFSAKGLQKFLYFSTIHVYGPLSEGCITEEKILKPGNVYALTHAQCEQICDYYNRTTDVQAMVVRLSNSYGQPVFPGNNCWWLAVNDLCRSAWNDNVIRLLSNGSPQRDFIHGRDVCQGVALLLENQSVTKDPSVFHLSSSNTFTLLELAGMVRDVYREEYGKELPVHTSKEENVTRFDTFTGQARYTIENKRLAQLGFSPRVELKEGIRALFHYFENNDHA